MEKLPLKSNGATKTDIKVRSIKQEISDHDPKISAVSVSWSVPHRKEGKNPGFYSDYSRPRTRPPSHN